MYQNYQASVKSKTLFNNGNHYTRNIPTCKTKRYVIHHDHRDIMPFILPTKYVIY